jgi:hypothetical protein
MVGGFALDDDGVYVIAGLLPGSYIVRAEPLDDASSDSFFSGEVDIDFLVTYGATVAVAPAGGGSVPIDVAVRPK